LSDGSAIQINMSTMAHTTIGVAGTFYLSASGFVPFARQWGSTYLLICNRNTTNDYWVWDGAFLYTAGTAAPQGVNLASVGFSYSTVPTVVAYGGSGSGMTFTTSVNNGAIQEIQLTNPGSGYLPGDIVQLQFSGGGSNNSAVLQAVLTAGTVGGVSISAYGTGYTSAPAVGFSGGGGAGAHGVATISVGVTGVTGLVSGAGYTSPPSISFTGGGGGSGATAVATILSGAVTGVVITNPGSGYTAVPTIVFTGGGYTTIASATAVTSSGVLGVSVDVPGSGYTSAPAVNFTGGGYTTIAVGTAVLAPAGLGAINVISSGNGFTTVPTLTITGGGGSGATALAVLAPTSVARVNITSPGANYKYAPTVAFTGVPTGATAPTGVAILKGGQVVGVTLTNAGSNLTSSIEIVFTNWPGDTTGAGAGGTVVFNPTSIASVTIMNAGQYYTNAPQVIVNAGANSSASATVSLMPFGVSGSSLETYLSRVWIVAPAFASSQVIPAETQWSFSAAGAVWDFATTAGGGSANNTDAYLQTKYTGIRQSSGYLYFFGDGSASSVSNVGTTGTPATTTYNYQNIDPQAGLSWRDTLQEFGRSLVAANETGFYGLYGGAMTKVSAKIDQLLSMTPAGPTFYPQNGGVVPSSAAATIFNVRHYLSLMTIAGPSSGVPRNVMIAWNEKDWFVASQSVQFTRIAEQKVGSEYTAWGTDGKNLQPLFQTPSASLTKRLWTKSYGADSMFVIKEALYLWLQGQDQSVAGAGISGTVLSDISTVGSLSASNTWTFPSTIIATVAQQPQFLAPAPSWPLWGTSMQGVAFATLGLRFTTTSPDFILGNVVIGYRNVRAYSD
jgi:hypothetical protein